MVYMQFWVLCCATLAAAVVAAGVTYRLNSVELGLKPWGSEAVTIACIGALQALLLFLVWKLLGWTHWMQYLVAGAIAAIGYKASHVEDMEGVEPLIIALFQVMAFWPALKIAAFLGARLSRKLLPYLPG